MPNLNGKERKDKIRADRARLSRDLMNERTAHRKTTTTLKMARAKIAEQAAQIKRMKEHLLGAISEADRDIGHAVFERYEQSFQIEFDKSPLGCIY